MKTKRIVALSGLVAVFAQVEAAVDIRFNNTSNRASISATFDNLNSTITNDSPVTGSQVMSTTGDLTAKSSLSDETFNIEVDAINSNGTAATGWVYADAVTEDGKPSPALMNYVNGRNDSNIGGNDSGWGPATTNNGSIDTAEEAMTIEFTLTDLDSFASGFQLQGFYLGNLGSGDTFNYMVVDSSGDIAIAKNTGMTVANTTSTADGNFFDLGNLLIETGDVLIIGFEGGDFKLDGLQVDVVPEPSAYALIGGILALGSVMMRRRRS